ncbi:MAG TPA: tetratricopeptide repeat protein [Chthoniobacterales bacterium]|nr:tetratricopeptide repeat protein [Chthoniobacterales bacterium]
MTIAVYRPAWNGGFLWDDDAYVTKNTLLTAPDGLRRIWFSLDAPSQYFPLVYTTFRIERGLWNLNPTGYHWVNLLLHVANALLVWCLLVRLKVPGAWLAAAIFALHPVQVESVAWITERKNVLMGFFFFLTLLAWVEYVDLRTTRRWVFYAAALILYLMALSAKTTACTLPAALLLVLWLKKIPITWQRLLQIIPFLLLGLGMGLIAVWWERYHQGTRGALFALNPLERLLVASRAVWFYLSKLFWPSNLTFIYPQWSVHARDPLSYLWLFATGGLGVAIYFARRFFGRSVEVASLFFVATLSPLLGFIMLYTFRYTFVADHYQYLASIAPIALVSAGIVRLEGWTKYGRQMLRALGIALVVALSLLTYRQSATYRDIETLWRTTIARNPSCWMAYNNLGIALVERGEVDEAISQYDKSLQLHPDYAQAHYNLGNALLQKGKVAEAIAQCEEALRLQPNDADAHVALGNALLTGQNVDEAIAHYSKALELHPDDSTAYYNLGNAMLAKGEVAKAAAHYQKALELQPNVAEAHIQLGNVFLRNNNGRQAISHYEAALKISPHSAIAQIDLAWALASAADRSLRNGARAIELAEAANRSFRGEDAITLHATAAAYAENGQFNKAMEIAQRALQLALKRGDSALADQLRREMTLYQAGSAYREF